MKILIITYWKETNPGTFLQAYGVQYALRKKYPNAEISYVNYTNAIKETSVSKNAISDQVSDKLCFFQKVKHVIDLKRRSHKFAICQQVNMHCDNNQFPMYMDDSEMKEFVNYANGFDALVIGSDTIIESCNIEGRWGIMWPSEEIKAKKFFFAASADSANNLYEKTQFHAEMSQRVRCFSQIGLRDYVTINFFKDYLGISDDIIIHQPDPTFFLPLHLFKIENDKLKGLPRDGRKIIFYHFDRRFKYRKQLADLLKQQGYFLFTSEYDPNVHKSFGALNPFEWAALFAHCDYVLTERFHDTVFSMRYSVPVITVDWRAEVMNENKESKRLSILKDFDCADNHAIIKSIDDLQWIINRLKVIDSMDYHKKVEIKVNEYIEIANKCLNAIDI